MSIFLGNTASNFNAATNATSGQTQNASTNSSTLPIFGKKYDFNSVTNEPLVGSRDVNVSDSSIFGYPRAPAFGVSSNSHCRTARLDSYSFGQPAIFMSGSKGKESTPPFFKSSGFGKSAFGINQKGSRIASYIATPENNITGPSGGKFQSICGMQAYKDKSQEELRFEDYQLGDKGQECGSSFSVSTAQGFGLINNTRPFISPVLNQSTVDQPFYSHFPSTFTVERAGVDSLSKYSSHIFPPNPSLLNSCGTRNRVESTASDVSFSPWNNSNQFAPFKPASSSSTASTTPLRNPLSLSTSAPLSPCSVSPSTYPSLTKPSGPDFYQKNSFSPTPVLTTGGASQSTLCCNCLKQSQPTPAGLSNVSSTPLAANQNTPLFLGPLQPEITPKVGTTLPITNTSHPTTDGASCSEIGQGVGQQPSMNGQQSYFPVIVEVKPSPNMPPAETQPPDQISLEHPYLETSIQYGISSLPVSDNPAPVRRRSSLIIRHSSLSHHRLPPQKYKPTSDKPKVPFFMDKENATGVLKTEVIIIPRENPRDWVRPTTESPQGADTSMDRMHDGDKVLHKLKLQSEETHHDNCGDDKDVDGIMPKLQRADYYTVPPIEELLSKEKEEAGFCWHVKDFVVGRHGYGSIKFLGETDIRKLDLDSAVRFNHREVIIYMDESKKPPVGKGLNKPAEITLLNVKCINKSSGKEYRDGPMVNKYKDMLIKKAVEQDAEFVSYDPVEGQWKFRVSHF
ncbi:nuclear pore complex protein NUP98A-like isoform X6 [Solanum pennellii]|uniref:Nuclear pore complex protein NUP98A-like isoform X6 n=1 Tax=Solanum pennellii TaxID=28526 RepID=A0ABM1FYH0_SOLPN|nr:nuclear pore complex protein NUP98A-like isoform X6 [Solanum pennellii]